jgi:hypothetical protein
MNLRLMKPLALFVAGVLVVNFLMVGKKGKETVPNVAPKPLQVPWTNDPQGKLSKSEQASVASLKQITTDSKRRPEQRVQAIFYLAESRNWDGVEALLSAMDDESLLVRGRAAAAVRHVLGTDFYFHADDAKSKRQESIDGIRRYWESRKNNPPEGK